ncbi:MAG: methyltransferase domain-containing protein [Candidatus Omnitrophica bacterium]|nr:methyltransferase domain-containing protein [Candidatus Omnitrophota bacterium]
MGGKVSNTEPAVFNTGSSTVVEKCQICANPELKPIIFLGYLPPVNKMNFVGEKPHEQPSYPAQLLYCPKCHLVQLGLLVDAKVLFPPEYPYTSSTTKILRDNFAGLYSECEELLDLAKDDLVIDIGSNDGNLLSNFKDNHRVLGITPEDIGKIAIERGIPTILDYFKPKVVEKVLNEYGKAKIITATNVFAHIENVHEVLDGIIDLLEEDGVFITESHYLLPLEETLQYDTIYHEHLRYYSLHSLKYLLESHGLEIFHAKPIPTHGGSIRVYAAKKGKHKRSDSVQEILGKEKNKITGIDNFKSFKDKVVLSKIKLYSLLLNIKNNGEKIYGISAPSRASTLINYVGLDDGIIDYVLEIKGSHKIGKYIPGTLIPVVDETVLYEDQPEYAIIFSWHIADELIPKIKDKGFKGKFIVPLPEPEIIK